MNLFKKSKALVLSSIPYRDFDRIVTYFSEIEGLIKVIVLGGNRIKKRLFCEPLSLIELVYKPKKNDLYAFIEGKVLDSFLNLRESFDHIKAAMALLQITSKSQFPQAPSEKIFLLLTSYLKKLSEFENPQILVSSFLLKMLLLDGGWTIQTKCSKCRALLDPFYYTHQGYFCKTCTPSKNLSFEVEDIQKMGDLIYEKSFQNLSKISLSESLSQKIHRLFELTYQ